MLISGFSPGGTSQAKDKEWDSARYADTIVSAGGLGAYSNAGIYNYTLQALTTATNLVAFSIILWSISATMDLGVFGVRIPGFLFWCAVGWALFGTGVMHLIGRKLSAQLFRQQAVEANFRFDLARVREYGEQIALLKGEPREIDRADRVFGVSNPSAWSSEHSRSDAADQAERTGLDLRTIAIAPIFDSYQDALHLEGIAEEKY